ncbi:D-alanyl-D-alanine carboxypeptidase [bacterium]|nr:D-alanyl-D-alanine carboxypeptidase [bacterium]
MFRSQKTREKPLILSSNLENFNTKKKPSFRFLIFVLVVALMAVGFYFLNVLISNYLEWQYSKDIYQKALMEMPVDYSFLKPFRNWSVEPLELNAKAAISFLYTDQGKQRVLYAKNINQPLPIASISKLFTAYFAVKSFNLKREVEITKEAIDTEEDTGQFWLGEKFVLEELLHSVLIESSNDAAMAIADLMGKDKFIELLNQEVRKIGLKKTYLHDPVGVDPDFPEEKYNFSTAYDLAKFAAFLIKKSWQDPRVNLIWEITKKKEYYLYRPDGSFHHKIISTNKLLSDEDFIKKYKIIGGKTGYTPMAKECFLLVIEAPNKKGIIINVILGSEDRFKEMKKLTQWIKKAYIW